MKTKKFGCTGIRVSEIGLGTWQLGSDWKKVDEQTAQEILEIAYEKNVTFFDTADVYGQGLSERRIGKFLKTGK